jgi:hypothetical protein
MSGQASRHTLKIRLACYNAAGRHQHRDRPWRDVRAAYSAPPQPKREESLHRGCRRAQWRTWRCHNQRGLGRQPANQYRVRSFLCSPLLLYLEIPAWSPVPGLFCSALSIARRLTRNRASPNRRVHNRIAAGLAATVKLALCGFCTTDTNNILAENRWSLANRVRLHESVSSENSR